MSESQAISKLQVTCELLECSLESYSRSKYFACIHLAGAAEELLGEYLRREGMSSSLNSWRTDGLRVVNAVAGEDVWAAEEMVSRLKYARNRTKHMKANGDAEVLFESEAEAFEVLERAVSDFYKLAAHIDLPESVAVKQFNLHVIGKSLQSKSHLDSE